MVALTINTAVSATIERIYAAHAAQAARDGDRPHLGASLLGHECLRYLFYSFRWQVEPPDGRVARLFQTGHREEARIIAELRAIGVDVHDRNPDSGDQFRFTALGGHIAGSADGIIEGGLSEAPKSRHLLEIKTSNSKQFSELKLKGVQAHKPLHYAQMQIYMWAFGLERAYYLCLCKDTDDLYAERLAREPGFAEAVIDRATPVVFSIHPYDVPRLSNHSGWYVCKWCSARAVCHEGATPRRHCRSCVHAFPDPDGGWHCRHWEKPLTVQRQRHGCPAWATWVG